MRVPDPRAARPTVGEIEGLRDGLWSRGVARVLLAGAGGVGVAAEALAGDGARLRVLDGCEPVQLADALEGDLASTVLVVSAPPGTDPSAVEVVREAVAGAFAAEGLDPAEHTVLVAPTDSPLVAQAGGAPVVPGPGNGVLPGAWAALTPYALVPAGLAGADVGALLGDALAVGEALVPAPNGTSVRTGAPNVPFVARGGEGAEPGAGALARRIADADVVALTGPLAEALAQLLAVLPRPRPLVVETPGAPGWAEPGVLTAGVPGADVPADGPPAAELLRWQHAVAAVPGAALSGTAPARRSASTGAPDPDAGGPVRAGAVEIRAPWPVTGLADALARLVDGTPDLAVHAHLDRHDDASAALLRTELAARTGIGTSFGWGGRTAPRAAAVVQVTGAGPDGPAAAHQQAVAEAEAAELERAGVRVLRLHLADRLAGLVELVRAVQELPELT